MKILVINGYENHIDAKGNLNHTLFTEYVNQLRNTHDIQVTFVNDYRRDVEINKWLWADLIIIQFPIYWFNVPGKLKTYFDDVFAYEIFYGFTDDEYGNGGKLVGKKYILSSTWNAPTIAFNNENAFFSGASVKDILQPTIKALNFIGVTAFSEAAVISFHDVIHNPQVKYYLEKQKALINEVNA